MLEFFARLRKTACSRQNPQVLERIWMRPQELTVVPNEHGIYNLDQLSGLSLRCRQGQKQLASP